MKTPFPEYDADLVADIEDYFELDRVTQVVSTDGPDRNGLVFTTAKGHMGTAVQPYRTNSRPMFQIFPDGTGSAFRQGVTPCPGCDDWARTSSCTEHYELTWNPETRKWDGRFEESEYSPAGYYSSSGTLNARSASRLHRPLTGEFRTHLPETLWGNGAALAIERIGDAFSLETWMSSIGQGDTDDG